MKQVNSSRAKKLSKNSAKSSDFAANIYQQNMNLNLSQQQDEKDQFGSGLQKPDLNEFVNNSEPKTIAIASKIKTWSSNFLADFGFRFNKEFYQESQRKIDSIKILLLGQKQKKKATKRNKSQISPNSDRIFNQEGKVFNQEKSSDFFQSFTFFKSAKSLQTENLFSSSIPPSKNVLKKAKLFSEENQLSHNLKEEAKNLNRVSFGKICRKCRIEQGLSIEQVSFNLKVSPKDILVLEADEIEKISRNIYIVGFIRSFGKALKIDSKIIEEKIRDIDFKSNTDFRNHNLINIGRSLDLSPSKDIFLNFSLASIAVFLAMLLVFNFLEDKSANTSTDKITAKLAAVKVLKE